MIDIDREQDKMNQAKQVPQSGLDVKMVAVDEPANKAKTEIQLQFLIDQLIHYLSIFNK
jgi:hypothetical protein